MPSCLNTALRLLSRKDHSCRELALKLKRRGFEASQIDSTVNECRRMNYLDDEAFCRRYAGQLRRKGYGIHRIEQMLKTKGLAPELIHAGMRHSGMDELQFSDCRNAMAKKIKSSAQPFTMQTKARLYRFLYNRGFSADTIQQVFSEVAWEES